MRLLRSILTTRSCAVRGLQSTVPAFNTTSFKFVSPVFQTYGQRLMSTEARQHLADVLDEQIKEEEENSTEFEAVETSEAPEGWTMTSDDKSGLIVLTNDMGNGEVATVTVNAYNLESDEGNVDQHEEDEAHGVDGEHSEDEAQETAGNYGAHATIEFSRQGGHKLIFDAVAWSKSGFELSNLSTNETTDSEAYHGPRITDLDETLTEAIHEYLAERGVDEDLAAFAAGHAWKKEHFAYRGWLNKLSAYVKN